MNPLLPADNPLPAFIKGAPERGGRGGGEDAQLHYFQDSPAQRFLFLEEPTFILSMFLYRNLQFTILYIAYKGGQSACSPALNHPLLYGLFESELTIIY